MSYEAFTRIVDGFLKKASEVSAEFSHDTEVGKYSAVCSDGTTITGNSKTLGLTVRWGSGHQAMIHARA